MKARVEKVKKAFSSLADLGDSQMETTLFHTCLSLPKVAFSLRTCLPSHVGQTLGTFDDAMLEALHVRPGRQPTLRVGLVKRIPPRFPWWAEY